MPGGVDDGTRNMAPVVLDELRFGAREGGEEASSGSQAGDYRAIGMTRRVHSFGGRLPCCKVLLGLEGSLPRCDARCTR